MAAPTSAQNATDIEELKRRMDKYDEIIDDLRVIVIALKTRADTNQKWIATMLTVGATVVGAVLGAVVTHLVH